MSLFLVYNVFPSTMVMVSHLIPPPRYIRFPCPVQFARILSPFFLLPPLRPFLFSRPSTSSSIWSPVVRPSEVSSPPSDCQPNALLLVSCPASRMKVSPPPTCAAGGTWLGCGWRGEGYGAPREASPRSSVPFVDALGTSSILVVPVSLSAQTPPPLPSFPLQLYVSQYPPS